MHIPDILEMEGEAVPGAPTDRSERVGPLLEQETRDTVEHLAVVGLGPELGHPDGGFTRGTSVHPGLRTASLSKSQYA